MGDNHVARYDTRVPQSTQSYAHIVPQQNKASPGHFLNLTANLLRRMLHATYPTHGSRFNTPRPVIRRTSFQSLVDTQQLVLFPGGTALGRTLKTERRPVVARGKYLRASNTKRFRRVLDELDDLIDAACMGKCHRSVLCLGGRPRQVPLHTTRVSKKIK